MKYYAVLDTNVLVSALLVKGSVPSAVFREAMDGHIIPLYNDEIFSEYADVLFRKKFSFQHSKIRMMLDAIRHFGLRVEAEAAGVDLPDLDDVVFYEVVMEKRKDGDAYLVTGNQKHFPKEPFIVTPREMLDIIAGKETPKE